MRGAFLALGIALLASGAMAQDAAMPVAVGGGEGAACPQVGQASGEIEVRVGPGEKFEVYDHLKAGTKVFLCEKASGWYGIVYGKADCGVGAAITPRQGYMGACNTGWVNMRALTAAAE